MLLSCNRPPAAREPRAARGRRRRPRRVRPGRCRERLIQTDRLWAGRGTATI